MKAAISITFAWLVVLACALPTEAKARSMYCESRLVQVGDPIWQVGQVCPEPFWREHYDRGRAFDRFGRPVSYERIEAWTMNFGQRRLMRRLVFVDGRLRRVETLGYGVAWEPGTRRCTIHQLENAGNTVAEIFARCGEPDYRYDLSPPGPYGYGSGPHPQQGQRERWTYDFGPRQQARELEFLDGQLQRLTRPGPIR